jgi:hypothetical protein
MSGPTSLVRLGWIEGSTAWAGGVVRTDEFQSTKDTADGASRRRVDHPPCRSEYSYGPGEAPFNWCPLAASPVHLVLKV